MGIFAIFAIWMMFRIKGKLEQIRLTQLTPAQYAAEAAAKARERVEKDNLALLLTLIGLVFMFVFAAAHSG